MLFSTADTVPQSEHYVPPEYDMKDKFLQTILGFKDNGQHNEFGKILGWVSPVLALESGIAERQLEKGAGANDSITNTKAAQGRDIGKAEIVGAAALAATGIGAAAGAFGAAGATGTSAFASSLIKNAPQLIKTGVSTAANGLGTIKNNPDQTPQDRSYFANYQYKEGGQMKNGEDVAMIDKQSGKKVGEISYGEGILSKEDYAKIKSLVDRGNNEKLGKYMSTVIEKHEASEQETEMKKGGMLTSSKAKEILTDGTANGKALTPKQKRYMGWVAGGRKNKEGGEFKEYTDGGAFRAYSDGGELMYEGTKMYDDGGELGAPTDGGTPFDLGKGYGLENTFTSTPTQGFSNFTPTATNTLSAPSKDFLSQIGGAGQLFSLAQAATGLFGASGKLPEYQKPAGWNDYVSRANTMSQQGLSPQELALRRGENMDAYTLGENRVRSLGGGSSAFGLGESANLANQYRQGGADIAAANEEAKRRNFENYGNVISKDTAIGRQQFEDKYNLDYQTKQAAAKLANSGLQQIIDRSDFQKEYGTGSTYDKYLQAQIKKIADDNNVDYKTMLDLVNQIHQQQSTTNTNPYGGLFGNTPSPSNNNNIDQMFSKYVANQQ